MKTFTGTFHYSEADGTMRPVFGPDGARFRISARDEKEARRKLMDLYWDVRLDAADCMPVIVFDDSPAHQDAKEGGGA